MVETEDNQVLFVLPDEIQNSGRRRRFASLGDGLQHRVLVHAGISLHER